MKRASLTLRPEILVLALAIIPAVALVARTAAARDAGASAPTNPSLARDGGPSSAASAPPKGERFQASPTCQEHLGDRKDRPELSETFPSRGKSGYAAMLEVRVTHGKGETVLPAGLSVRLGTDEARALEGAGFAVPHPEGGVGVELTTEVSGEQATTTVRIPFVALPDEPGRQELTLPPVPITIARASGAVITLCTAPHPIVVEDPTANTPQAKPKPNPKARRQLEEWTAAKYAVFGALAALVLGALAAWLIARWLRRPRKSPPPPPPRPPWEVALEELFDIKNSGLVRQGRYRAHFDRVSHTIRRYLGDRYGFDGLESTTREMLDALGEIEPPIVELGEIDVFLRQADLVKFANLTPTEAECEQALERGEQLVRKTTPVAPPAAAISPSEPPQDDRRLY